MVQRYVEANRYHKIAKEWLKTQMEYDQIYSYLNKIGKQIKQHLEWKKRIPYIRLGKEEEVKQYILKGSGT